MKLEILSVLPGDHPWQNQIICFETIDSTNTRAKELARQGAPHGTVLIADTQTGGRGRLGRSFHSPAGTGLYMSVVLRPNCRPEVLMHLTCAAAVAACDAAEQVTGFRPGIKWTNDLVAGKRKLGGILTELGLSPEGHVDYAIIGIGINCTQQPEDFPEDIRCMAASLSSVTGSAVSRSRLAAEMMNTLLEMDRMLIAEKESIMDTYRRDCITLGQEISLVRGDEIRHGLALNVDCDGGLTVLETDGSIRTVTSGEVSVRGMYGYV